jgi:DNA-binding MarR family transcriptional regulator
MTDLSDANGSRALDSGEDGYVLAEQIGFLLRRANQRHLGIFSAAMPDGITARQFAVLVRLHDLGEASQNALGREVAMDQSTINGVVQRLMARGLVLRSKSASDQRRLLLSLTEEGRATVARALPVAAEITRETLDPLTERERATLQRLLGKIV